MKRLVITLTTIWLPAFCCMASVQAATDLDDPPVLAQDLASVMNSGKVAAALWTVRKDYCTLQIVMPLQVSSRGVRIPPDAPPPPPPRIQAWLLRPDGTRIPWLNEWRSPGFDKISTWINTRTTREINYRFPFSARFEAATVVIQINDDTFAEPLRPLMH